jgi:hypothetical protein
MTTGTYTYEYTDTICKQANYSWVKRGEVKAKSFVHAARLIKKELGIENVKCNREDYGDLVSLRPVDSCTVLFINWKE